MKRWMKLLIFTQMLLLAGVFGRKQAVIAAEVVGDVFAEPQIDSRGNISVNVRWGLYNYNAEKSLKTTAFIIYRATADKTGKWSPYQRIKTVQIKESRQKNYYYEYIDKNRLQYGKYYRYKVIPCQGTKRMSKNGDKSSVSLTPMEAKFLVSQLSVTSKAAGLHFVADNIDWKQQAETPKHDWDERINYFMPDGFALYGSTDGKHYEKAYECPSTLNSTINTAEGFYMDFFLPEMTEKYYKIQPYVVLGEKKKMGELSKPLYVNNRNLPGQFDLEIISNELLDMENKTGNEQQRLVELKLTSDSRNDTLLLDEELSEYRSILLDIANPISYSYSYDGKTWNEMKKEKKGTDEPVVVKPGESIYLRILICREDGIAEAVYTTVSYGDKKCVLKLNTSEGQAFVYPSMSFYEEVYYDGGWVYCY